MLPNSHRKECISPGTFNDVRVLTVSILIYLSVLWGKGKSIRIKAVEECIFYIFLYETTVWMTMRFVFFCWRKCLNIFGMTEGILIEVLCCFHVFATPISPTNNLCHRTFFFVNAMTALSSWRRWRGQEN